MNPGAKPIADAKLITFAVGQQKKSRFQKAREEKELKQKLDDAETAKVYDSFVSSFTEEEDGKTFIRGGAMGQREGDSVYGGGSKGEIYRMERKGKDGMSEMEKLMHENKSRDALRGGAAGGNNGSGSSSAGSGAKGKRQIDDFLNEIINRQENLASSADSAYGREDRDGAPSHTLSTSLEGGFIEKGSYDNGDPTTTNLYLGNISPGTLEEDLLDLFGRYGEINSVKIMWPRSEEEKARKRNCGFVSFRRRRDAEDALVELQDYELDGFKMVLGWGKAVKISATPFILPPSARSAPVPVPVPPVPHAAAPVALQAPAWQDNGMYGGGMQGHLPPPPMHHHQQHQQQQQQLQYTQSMPHQPPPPMMHPPPRGLLPPPAHLPPGFPAPPQHPSQYPPQQHQAHAAAHAQYVQHPGHPQQVGFLPPPPLSAAPPAHNLPPLPPQPVGLVDPRLARRPPPAPAEVGPLHPPVLPPGAAQGLPAPPLRAPPSQPVQATSAATPMPKPNPVADLATMSVDSFLDSIIASTSTSTSSAPVTVHALPLAQQAPTHRSDAPVPVFHKPPTMVPPPSVTTSAAVPPAVPLPSPAVPVPVRVDVQVTLPADPARRALIDLMAKFCAADGEAFEKVIKAREEGNPAFSFLFDLEGAEGGQYYRWRTYANVWGDTDRRWSTEPLQWSLDGLVLGPPAGSVAAEEEKDGQEVPLRDKHAGARKRSRSRSRSAGRRRHDHDNERRGRSPSPEGRSGRVRSDSFSGGATEASRDRADQRKRRRSASRSRSRSHSRDRRDAHSSSGNRDRERGRMGGDRQQQRSARERDRDREERERADRSRYAGMTGAQIERERAKKRLQEQARLGREDYQHWKECLQQLDLSRQKIKEAMGFAFDKIESAEEVIGMVKDKLILPSSYAAVKVAGLYLLSDILHNTGAPVKHASTYRGYVQAALPEVMEDVSRLFHTTTGRMSAFNIEDRVKKLFSVWAEWSVFPTLYLVGLEAVFYTTEAERAAMADSARRQAEAEELDGVSMLPGAASEVDQLESLRRRARLCAVPHTDKTSKHELQCRLEHAERYTRTKYGQSGAAAISTLLAPALSYQPQLTDREGYDESDIDGVPIDVSGLTPLERMVQQQLEDRDVRSGEGYMDDDDIDGVPIGLAEYSIPVSGSCPPGHEP